MPAQDAIYRFGPYELRTRTHEVYKNGTKLKVRPQPFQVLQALVQRSGDVVTREELRQLLWPAETFVEHGLNTAIKELRGLLNDSASEPRYIETLPKLGYRMMVAVEAVERGLPSSLGTSIEGESAQQDEKQQRAASEGGPYAREERRSKDRPLQKDGGVNPPLHRQEERRRSEDRPLQEDGEVNQESTAAGGFSDSWWPGKIGQGQEG